MGGYALYLLGVVFIGYGIYLAKQKKVFMAQNVETFAILLLLLISQMESRSFFEFSLLIAIFGVISLAMSNRNYVLYHADGVQVQGMVKAILDKNRIPYEVKNERFVLTKAKEELRLRANGNVVMVNMVKAKTYHSQLKDELKAGYMNLEVVYSKSGIIIIAVGVLSILFAVFFR